MNKQTSCADPFEADAISVDDARSKIFEEISPITESEKLALRACLNRYLAEDIYSPIDVPSHINSAMDGYAIAGDDLPHKPCKATKSSVHRLQEDPQQKPIKQDTSSAL